jgi:hypothetical protein
VTAATATTREILQAVGVEPRIPNAGAALAGAAIARVSPA